MADFGDRGVEREGGGAAFEPARVDVGEMGHREEHDLGHAAEPLLRPGEHDVDATPPTLTLGELEATYQAPSEIAGAAIEGFERLSGQIGARVQWSYADIETTGNSLESALTNALEIIGAEHPLTLADLFYHPIDTITKFFGNLQVKSAREKVQNKAAEVRRELDAKKTLSARIMDPAKPRERSLSIDSDSTEASFESEASAPASPRVEARLQLSDTELEASKKLDVAYGELGFRLRDMVISDEFRAMAPHEQARQLANFLAQANKFEVRSRAGIIKTTIRVGDAREHLNAKLDRQHASFTDLVAKQIEDLGRDGFRAQAEAGGFDVQFTDAPELIRANALAAIGEALMAQNSERMKAVMATAEEALGEEDFGELREDALQNLIAASGKAFREALAASKYPEELRDFYIAAHGALAVVDNPEHDNIAENIQSHYELANGLESAASKASREVNEAAVEDLDTETAKALTDIRNAEFKPLRSLRGAEEMLAQVAELRAKARETRKAAQESAAKLGITPRELTEAFKVNREVAERLKLYEKQAGEYIEQARANRKFEREERGERARLLLTSEAEVARVLRDAPILETDAARQLTRARRRVDADVQRMGAAADAMREANPTGETFLVGNGARAEFLGHMNRFVGNVERLSAESRNVREVEQRDSKEPAVRPADQQRLLGEMLNGRFGKRLAMHRELEALSQARQVAAENLHAMNEDNNTYEEIMAAQEVFGEAIEAYNGRLDQMAKAGYKRAEFLSDLGIAETLTRSMARTFLKERFTNFDERGSAEKAADKRAARKRAAKDKAARAASRAGTALGEAGEAAGRVATQAREAAAKKAAQLREAAAKKAAQLREAATAAVGGAGGEAENETEGATGDFALFTRTGELDSVEKSPKKPSRRERAAAAFSKAGRQIRNAIPSRGTAALDLGDLGGAQKMSGDFEVPGGGTSEPIFQDDTLEALTAEISTLNSAPSVRENAIRMADLQKRFYQHLSEQERAGDLSDEQKEYYDMARFDADALFTGSDLL